MELKMKKNNSRPVHTMPRHEPQERSEPPSPQAIIEAQRAAEAASRNPIAYSMGEPLPGRSMLDKLRARQAAEAAALKARIDEDGAGDSVISLDQRRALQRAARLKAAKRKARANADDSTESLMTLRTASEIEATRRASKGYPPVRRDGSHGE